MVILWLMQDSGLIQLDFFLVGSGNIIDGSNGDVAVDQYNRYKVGCTCISFLYLFLESS